MGQLKGASADKFRNFLTEGINFAISDNTNFNFLCALIPFVNRGFLTPQ